MQLSRHCFALAGFAYIPPWGVNAGIVAGENITLVVDSGPTRQAAATIYGYATALRPSNQILVINTEQHLDHVSGNSYFAGRGIEIYGHCGIRRNEEELQGEVDAYTACIPNAVRRQQEEGRILFAGTRLANPSTSIEQNISLNLGGISAEVILTPGHTPTNLSVYVPVDGVVFCGDSVVSGYLPNLEGGDSTEWGMWIESLDRLASLGAQVMACGHGPMVEREAVPKEMDRIRAILREAIATGRPPTV